MKKRIISILLIICMIMTLMPATALAASQEAVAQKAESEPAATFKDVSKSDWFYSSVNYAIEHNIFNGTGKDTFSPFGTMTRGMYVTIMGRIAGVIPSDYAEKGGFADVDKDAYYAPYVAWAVKNGITAGVGNNSFDPEGIVNREQMAVFTIRYFEAYDINYSASTDVATTPGDLTNVSDWAQESVLKLWKAGLLSGDNNGNFNPKSNATRAEAATFSMRTNERVETWRAVKVGLTPTPPPNNVTAGTTNNDSDSDSDSGPRIYYTVTFNSNGGTDVASVSVASGETLSGLPSPKKTNAVFLGWYTDSSLQGDKLSEEDTIHSNLTLYAKYMVIEGALEIEQDDSYSLADQESGLTFNVVASDSSMTTDSLKSDITLEIIDGSEPVSLVVNGSNGVFTVAADGGFKEGASYKLTLNDGSLSFSDKTDTKRTCSFTIKKQESFDIEFNEGIIYIPSGDLSDIIKNETAVDSLSVPLIEMTDNGGGNTGSNAGTFTYNGGKTLKTGDVLCVYSGAKPEAGDDTAYLNEDIAYIQVTDVSGNTVSYCDADSRKVLFLPDVLPIYAGEGEDNKLTDYINDTESGSFSISISDLDFSQYSEMGLNADTTIDKGDYIALYFCDDLEQGQESDVIYGRVTAVALNSDTVSVTFAGTTVSEMMESLDYYSQNDIKGDTLLEGVDTGDLQEIIEQQVLASNFANKAAEYMTEVAMSTEGFKKFAGDRGSIEMNENMMQAAAPKISEIEDLKVNVEISDNTKKLSDGVRCAVEVSFTVPVDMGGNSAVNINLSATFVEEVKMSISASADDIWTWKYIIPIISEYKVSADIDVYDFTGFSFKSTITSDADTQTIDISQEIQDILAYTDTKEIKAGVQDLFETYSDMMQNETEWITIFEKSISESNTSLLLGVIQIKTTINFVVGANINVALGCNFEYKSGTRYCFWAKLIAMDAGSSTVDLMDETYTFQFYVMGSLGLRAGINLEFAVGLFSTDLDSIGLTAEAGVYAKLYGYFFYELESVKGVKKSDMSGALYLELGVYLEIAFKAQVIGGTFQYNPMLVEEEWPLWTAGDRYDVYDFAYKDTNSINLKDKVRYYTLPDSTFDMTSLDLKEGDISTETYPIGDYEITFSNSNFGLIGKNVVVKVPANTHLMKCDMTVRWKDSSLAFSSVPIERKFRLYWDDINDAGYTIIFNSNGGSGVSSITKPFGATVTAPNAPTKTGYTFKGWYSDKELTKAYTFSRMGWENIILYAKWTANTNTVYKVNHYQQDVANSSSYTLYNTESFTGTTAVGVTPAVKNYTGFTAPSPRTIIITADGSKVVNYYYTRKGYTLTFKPVNGGNDIVKTVKYGASISAPAVTKPGFTFNGWNSMVAGTMPAANTTYTAQWTVNTYTVSFDSNSGSSCNSITVTYGTAYGSLPVPTRTGYTFNGWYASETANNGTGTQITSATTASITSVQILYAKWASNTNTAYKVKHYQQNVADDNYALYETENLTGATGAGVTPNVMSYTGFTAPSVQSVNISADGSTEVNYEYTRNSYMLTFDANGGTGGTSDSVRYGASISVPEVTKPDYDFNGWDPEVADTMPAEDTTYTAQWTASAVSDMVSTLNELLAALADDSIPEVTVTQVIELTNGTVLDGQSKTVRAETTGIGEDDNIQDGSAYNIFTIADGSTVTIQNLTVKGGSYSAINNEGTLTMNGVTITQSGSAFIGGGGLQNSGKVVLTDCVITKNVADYGAGFLNSGSSAVMIMEDSSVILNSSLRGGGGGENNGEATLYLNNCTFAKNMSSEIGGAINNYNGTLYVLNSTITGNMVNTDFFDVCGGGIGNNGGTVYAVNSLLTNNFEQHSSFEVKPSDIGAYSGESDIHLYNSYCGAYVTDVIDYLAATGEPDSATVTDSVYNPDGNGLNDIFDSYSDWSYLNCPTLVEQSNGTYAAPLTSDSTAMSGGCDVYFEYSESGVTLVAYGSTPDYLIGDSAGTPITVYQGGGTRVQGVIGAIGDEY